ncbi:MAG: 1,6-anhydro-N-acetylmuramyl-L-alanine amidase AmpD [Pseudomonadota bacterium]
MELQVDPTTGLLAEARQLPSPNCDERPEGSEPELIVVHNISLPPGQFGGPWIDALFTNRLDPNAHPFFTEIHQMRVSSHLLIRRDGELVQYVPFHRRAWHAGISCFEGRKRCNDFSIGIELEGTDETPYETLQYQRLAMVITALQQAYPGLETARLAGHSDIAPGRKTDPGPAFDWSRLHTELARLDEALEMGGGSVET